MASEWWFFIFSSRNSSSECMWPRVVRTSDVLPKVMTSCDFRTSTTLPRGKSPTVQRMGEFCTLGVADGYSDQWKSACPSDSPSARRLPGRRHRRPPGGRLFFLRGRPPTRPHARWRRPSLRASARPSAREKQPSTRPSTPTVCYRRPPSRLPAVCQANGSHRPDGRPLAVRQADHTADGLLRPPGRPLRGRPPASSLRPAAPLLCPVDLLRQRYSSGEYKEGSTNTLSLLPNLCFPRALSCTLHLLLGKPLLRKSEIVLGVSFGTPNTISAAWLLHSFIPYFCTHPNGQQTMVPLVHRNLSRSWQRK